MKYKIWRVKDIDFIGCMEGEDLKVIDIEKYDCSSYMFISPEGKFMAWGIDREEDDEFQDNPALGNVYFMEQDPIYFELEILE
jgi:hypothetical protein